MKSIKLLSVDLLNNFRLLSLTKLFSVFLQRPQGWHYYFDQISLISNSKKEFNYKPKVLDCGAGLGITQFLYSYFGFDVYSLDFSKRYFPTYYKLFFNIIELDNPSFDYSHDYQKFITYNNKFIEKIRVSNFIFRLSNWVVSKTLFILSIPLFLILMLFNKGRGTIYVVRAPFHKIPFEDSFFDLVVSVSAIEHSDIDILDKGLKEFKRVLKSSGQIMITTSLSNKGQSYFHEPTKGICFDSNFLCEVFHFDKGTINIEGTDKFDKDLFDSYLWKLFLSSYYKINSYEFFKSEGNLKSPYFPIIIFDEKY
uniref:methyltransferase domain-containing protein n=1 Tax=Flavobacterium sp. TaxID=239 RepID=UPI004049EF42